MSKLMQAVDELTRRTHHYERDADGERVLVQAAPLLVQLRMEVAGSTSGSGGGSSSTTAAIPLAAAAYDLLQEIRQGVSEEWWAVHHLHHGAGRGTLVGELRMWAAVCQGQGGDLEKQAERLCCSWVAAITALLQPVRRWEITGACPACKARRAAVSDDLGQPVYGTALVIEFRRDGAEGRCRACQETFDPQVLAQLMRGA